MTIGTVFFSFMGRLNRHESEVIPIKTPVSRVGNKTSILHILYALFPLNYGRFIDVFGGSGSVLLGNPTVSSFEVYNDFDRNLANLFHCMKERTMATIRELGFCHLNSREDFIAIRRFFENEVFDDLYLSEELKLTEILFPPPEAKELMEIRTRITEDYDVRRAAMFLKLLRFSYSSSGKSYASQPFDIRKLFGLIAELQTRMANVIVENQDFETLIKHYDRPDAFFYADPPYFSTEDMYEVGFGWDDHVRLRDTLKNIKGKFLLSYNDCPEYESCTRASRSLTSPVPIQWHNGMRQAKNSRNCSSATTTSTKGSAPSLHSSRCSMCTATPLTMSATTTKKY